MPNPNPNPTPTILFAGGGSVGHIAPGVAVARALKEKLHGLHVHFVCSKWPTERKYLEKEGFSCTGITAPKLNILFPWTFVRSLFEAHSIVNTLKPDLIFSKGGYISVPVCLIGKMMGIPIILHESDAVMGRANSLIARWADHICTGFNLSTLQPFNLSTFTGNPLRPEVTTGDPTEGWRITGFGEGKPVLIVVGGSQGAETINHTIENHIDELLTVCNIIHITGPGKKTAVEKPGYFQREFVNDELPHLYAISSFAVSRASASFTAELTANGIPIILIPLKGLAHDHQSINAKAIMKSGGCITLDQDATSDIISEIVRLSVDHETRKKMSDNIRHFSTPDAAGQIAEIVVQTLDKGQNHQ